MKVAFIHDNKFIKDVNNNVYDKGAFNYNLFKRYLKHFDQIYVMGRKVDLEKDKILNMSLSSGPNVEFYFNEAYTKQLDFFINYKSVSKKVRELIKEVEACIIRLPSTLGIIAVRECIKAKKPFAIEVVGCYWDSLWFYGNIQGKVLAPIMYLLTKRCVNKSKYAIYVTQEFLQKRYPCKGKIANASNVNIHATKEVILKNRIDKINDRKDGIIDIGLIGSLDVAYKGHETAIKAIKILKNKGYKIKLKCVGPGDCNRWKKIIDKQDIEEQIEFCGTLPAGEAILEWLDGIDIFIIPSLTEGLPRALVEAMSRACPAIGSNVGGIPELLDESVVIDAKNYNKLADKLIQLIENKELAIEQAKRNFIISKKYSKEELDEKREEFWEEFKNSINK